KALRYLRKLTKTGFGIPAGSPDNALSALKPTARFSFVGNQTGYFLSNLVWKLACYRTFGWTKLNVSQRLEAGN
ncbi:MAG TPA: hypothetical protein VEY71_08920, partial [Chitinophagales bacterium]|nr:hypothetical protein [Chitinophagales bacterium]